MSAQTKVYLDCKFQKNGHMDGSPLVKKAGSLDVSKMLECSYIQHEIKAPVDMLSGQARGRRQHSPFHFLIELENASVPLLYQALCSNDSFESAKFHFPRTNPKGETEIYQEILLTNGHITSIELVLPNVLDPTVAANIPAHLKIGFSYMDIEWNNIAKKTGKDSWTLS